MSVPLHRASAYAAAQFAAVLILLVGLLSYTLPAVARPPGVLVDVAWLQRHLGQKDLIVLDTSFPPMHQAGHIPGAVNVDVFSFGGREHGPADMERLIRSWGIGVGKTVVIYDAGGSYLATSLFYDLVYHGVPASQLAILDGGFAKWSASGGATSKEATLPPPVGDFRVTARREELRVRLNEFIAASGDPVRHVILDALEPRYYYGGSQFFDRTGHVPRAVSMPTAELFNPDKTFKSPDELKRQFALLGIRSDQQVLSHCGGGIAASAPFFAAKYLAGYPQVKLYKESQLEWLRDDRGLPMWTYAAPQLLRDKNWLAGWNNQMMRMYGVTRINIIDVRSEDAYRQGHIPFALSLPLESLWRNIHDPQALAATLGASGVVADDEAIIVAEGGLGPRAALAYLALHAAGHTRISILVDSLDDWGLAGHAIVKTPTAIGPKKHPMDVSIPPTAYPARPRGDLFADGSERPGGAFPRIVIASGKQPSTNTPAGKMMHLPAADFLATGGAPKAAKDIHSMLAKAGVTRYAEIVLAADDPGDAAVNYLIFRLMGYPDIRVQLPSAATPPIRQAQAR